MDKHTLNVLNSTPNGGRLKNSVNYYLKTVVQLKLLCKERGLARYSSLDKLSLITLLETHDTTPPAILSKNVDNVPFIVVNYKNEDIMIYRTQDWFIDITSTSKKFGKTWRQ